MTKVPVTFACSHNDRTRAIVDGQVRVEGCDVTPLVLEPAEMFARACRYFEFDVTELSFSSYMRMVDQGNSPVHRGASLPVARVPAFILLHPNRSRHPYAGRPGGTCRRCAGISDDGRALAARHAAG